MQQGQYEFHEKISPKGSIKYVLTQNTFYLVPIVRGVVIENGVVADTIGFEQRNITDFIEGFLNCRHLTIKTQGDGFFNGKGGE